VIATGGAAGEGEVDEDDPRQNQPAHPGRKGQQGPAAVAELAQIPLSPCLETDDEEVQAHQPLVDDLPHRHPDRVTAKGHPDLGGPERAVSPPKTDTKGNNILTLGRLQELILASSSVATAEGVRTMLQPLRQVRKERQAPAHKIADPVTDANVVNRQRDLLRDIGFSLAAIRAFIKTHPAVSSVGWEPPEYLDNWQWL
jgi:hypothetical protein